MSTIDLPFSCMPLLPHEFDDIIPSSLRSGSLWPLLTGPVPRSRRPRLADDFYRSRSLWLRPLLAWVSEAWLPPPAREAAAGFVQRKLLPFLHGASSPASPAGGASGKQSVHDNGGVSEAISPRKKARQLRLVGNKLCAVAEEEGYGHVGDGDEFGPEAEEAKMLQALESAASVATATDIMDASPAQAAPEGPPEASRFGLAPSAPTNPFGRTAAPLRGALESQTPGDSSVASDGWSSTPWEERLGMAALTSAGGASPRPSSTPFTRSPRATPAPPFRSETVRPSIAGGARCDSPRSDVERSWEELPDHQPTARPSAVGDSQGSRNPTATSARRRQEKSLSSRIQMGSWMDSTATPVVAAAKPNSKVGSSEAHDGKGYVTAAEAAASASRAELAATRPRGSVVKRWREMQRKQTGETRAPDLAGAQNGSHQADRRAQAGLPREAKTASTTARPEAVQSHSAAANAAFAAAARATANRGDAPEGGSLVHEPKSRLVDHASIAEASSMELHKLVLSSWTIPELLKDPVKSARGGSRSQNANEGQDRRQLSGLWLPKVSCRSIPTLICRQDILVERSPVLEFAILDSTRYMSTIGYRSPRAVAKEVHGSAGAIYGSWEQCIVFPTPLIVPRHGKSECQLPCVSPFATFAMFPPTTYCVRNLVHPNLRWS